jgi:Phospholipid methyltransferase
MLKLPPPVWTLIFLVVAAALSFALGWPKVPGLPFPPLGIALVAIAFIPPVWAAGLFRREGTEINPTSPTNRTLVTRGPYRFTRNPMYLGLITFARRRMGRRLADVSGADRSLRHDQLRAHSIRRSEDAPSIRRGLRRLCCAGGALAVRLAPASAQATKMRTQTRQRKPVEGKICAGGDQVGVLPH